MQVKKQQLEPDMEQRTGSKIGKGECQGCMLSPCLFTLYAEYIMQNSRLDEAQAGIKIAGVSGWVKLLSRVRLFVTPWTVAY